MIVVVAILAVVVFAVAFKFSGILPIVHDALATSRRSLAVMADDALTDDEKEHHVRQAFGHLFKRFVQIVVLAAMILALPLLCMLGANALGLASYEAVMAFLLRWEVILATTAALVVASVIRR